MPILDGDIVAENDGDEEENKDDDDQRDDEDVAMASDISKLDYFNKSLNLCFILNLFTSQMIIQSCSN